MELNGVPVIIDTGQYQTRVGTSINNFPQLVIDTLLYEDMHEKEIKLKKEFIDFKQSLIGNELDTCYLSCSDNWNFSGCSLMTKNYKNLSYPFKYLDGIDWNLLETFWTDVITKELYYDITTSPILLSEPHNAPFDFQDHSMEFFFESLSVPFLKTISQEILSVNAIQKSLPNIFLRENGKGSVGIIVHFGDSSTRILPIASGYLLSEYIGTLNLGGSAVTNLLIKKFGSIFEDQSYISHQNMDIVKSLGIFDDYISNQIIPSLSDEIIAVVKKCPVDYTRLLLRNILFIGGASINRLLISNFKKYFEALLKGLEINLSNISVKSLFNSSSTEEKSLGVYSTWLGGCYSVRKEDFVRNHFFSKRQYEEYGSCAIRRLSNKDFLNTA